MRRILVIIALGLVGLLAAAGLLVSHNSRNESKSSAAAVAAPSAASRQYGTGSPSTSPGGSAIDLAAVKRASNQVIRTADVTVKARDVAAALTDATRVVDKAGGRLFSSDAELDDPRNRRVNAVFKVPPAAFDRVMRGLAGIGTVTSSRTNTQDVTAQVVDLDARIAAARTSAARLRDLLAHSGNVTDLLAVEQSLSQREGEVESLEGQRASLAAQVELATITLDLESAPPAAATPAPSHHIPGFLAGLRTGFAAFANTALVALTAFGFSLPFLVVVALAGWPVLRLVRRRQARAASSA